MADRPWCWAFVLAVCSFLISQVDAGSYCTTSYSSTSYCASGCCGSYGNQYCCGDIEVGLIVGGVMAGLFVVSIIIVIVCYAMKRKGRPGRVIQPTTQASTTNSVTVAYTGTPGQYPGPPPQYNTQLMGMQPVPPQYGMQPMGVQPMQQAPYGDPSTAPPAYNYSDPVYPPPPRA